MSRPTACRVCGAAQLWHEGLGWWIRAEGEYMEIDPDGPDVGYQRDIKEPVRGRWLPGVPKYDPNRKIAVAHRAHWHASARVGVEKGAGE